MPDPVLIGFPQSDFVWAVRIAAAEKGVGLTLEHAMPHDPAALAAHPFGKVPALRHGDLTLCESRAICAWIDRAFDGPALVPADPAAAALTEQWISLTVHDIEPVVIRRYLFAYLFPGTPDGAPDRAAIEASLAPMGRAFDALEAGLARGELGAGPFTLADAFLAPVLAYAQGAPEGAAAIAARPALAAYAARLADRPSVRATTPPPLPR